jgi:competence protein ComEA
MLKHLTNFLGGLITGLLAAGMLLLIIRPRPTYPIKLLPPPTAAPLQIHVAGAVVRPGVVLVPPGSIVETAIQAAGGPTEDADVTRLNLAQELQSGQQVFVPDQDPEFSTPDRQTESSASAHKINVNTADEVQLKQLPGIGPSLATSIVQYREAHGWFQEPDELLQISGIGPAKLEQIIDLITFH